MAGGSFPKKVKPAFSIMTKEYLDKAHRCYGDLRLTRDDVEMLEDFLQSEDVSIYAKKSLGENRSQSVWISEYLDVKEILTPVIEAAKKRLVELEDNFSKL